MSPVKETQNAAQLLGRAKDLQELHELLTQGARLVSVLGPPGVGKSRLAFEYARAWSNGAWICDARGAASPAQLAAALSATLGLSEADAAALGPALDARGPSLIVIDGYQQLVPEANATLGGWMQAAPEAQFLVTSRRRLELATEAVHELGPLAPADARALYHDRASAAHSGYQSSPEHEHEVAELVAHLGGLPLAIVLAAARARSIGPAQLVARLDTRLDLLKDGSTSLRGAIDDSWNDLDDSQRQVLAQASIFDGGFSLEAAEAVLLRSDRSRPVIDLLEELRDRSLLAWRAFPGAGSSSRFELDANIRDYALEQRRANARDDDCEQRHTSYFLGLSEAWRTAGDSARLLHDKQNLLSIFTRSQGTQRARAALASAASHNNRDELRSWHAALDDLCADLEPNSTLHNEMLLARGTLRRRLNLFGTAREDFAAAVAAARKLAKDDVLARALLAAGQLLLDSDERVRAGEAFREAVAAAQRCGQAISEARGQIGLARVSRNDPSAAHQYLESALALLARTPHSIYRAAATLQLGTVSLRLGRLGQAREHLQDAWQEFRRQGDATGEAEAQAALAVIDQERGDLPAAVARYASSVELLRANGDLAREAESLIRQGSCQAQQGLVDAARECFQEAHAGFRLVGNDQGMCEVRGHLGVMEAELGNLDAAERAFVDAESGGAHSLANRAVLQVQRGHLDIARGNHDTATARYRAARAAQDTRGWTLTHRSQALRSTMRQLERALEAPAPEPETGTPSDALIVASTGRWFRAPGQEQVDLGRRGGLRRLLCALADRRGEHDHDSAAVALSRDELLAIGWPGERIQPEAGARRVHTALWTLRKFGLRDLLTSRDDGYLLDTSVPLLRVRE